MRDLERIVDPAIVFLDVDGVLNSGVWIADQKRLGAKEPRDLAHLDPAAIQILNEILDQGEAVVVASATMRLHLEPVEIEALLRVRGFTGTVLDKTGKVCGVWTQRRGKEIEAWLATHPEVTRFAILDDDSDMTDKTRPHLIKTEFSLGLQREHIAPTVRLLAGQTQAGGAP